MKIKKNIVILLTIILFVTITFCGCFEREKDKETISIQRLIDNALPGDTIIIPSGIYYENIIINKSIDLIGSGNVKIIGNHSDVYYIVKFSSHWINMSNLNIYNGSTFSGSGISIEKFENITINNCKINFCRKGILIYNSKNIFIENCTFTFNTNGIFLSNSNMINLKNCDIRNNSDIGLFVEGVTNSNISKCNLSSNRLGIEIRTYYQPSIGFDEPPPILSINNNIYLCNFINNTENAYEECSNIKWANKWYNTNLNLGNYWDDYTGTDENGDGIGDTPYNISNGCNQDKYPLIR